MGLLNTAAKGMAWTTVSTVVRSVVSMLQVAILTRFLEKSDFGIVAIATLFIGFTQIFLDLGLSVGIMHKQDTTKEEYSSLFWLNIFCGIILTLVLMAISPFVAAYYKEESLLKILMLLSLTMLFSSLGSQHRTIQQKKMRFNFISIVEIITSVLTLLVAIGLVNIGWGIYSLVYSTLFNVACSNTLFLIIGLKNDKNISSHFRLRDTYPFMKIGVFSLGTQILDYFSREMDVIIISSTLGKDVLGIYSLCKKLILALYQAVNPILMKVMTPMLASIQDDIFRVKRVYFDIVQTLAIVNYPIYCLVAVFSVGILNFIYGPEYKDGCYVLALLALYYGYLTTGNPIGALQTALGRTDTGFYWTICRIIIYSVTIWISSMFGIEAILIGLIFVNLLVSPLSWRITVKPLLPCGFWETFSIYFIPFVLTIAFSLPFYLLFRKEESVVLALFVGIVYLLCYAVFAYFMFRKSYLVKLLLSKIQWRKQE